MKTSEIVTLAQVIQIRAQYRRYQPDIVALCASYQLVLEVLERTADELIELTNQFLPETEKHIGWMKRMADSARKVHAEAVCLVTQIKLAEVLP